MTITNRHKAKLSKQAEMQRLLSRREKGLQALDSPLRKVGANARARLRNRRIPDIRKYRPPRSALHAGRRQKGISRAFIAHDGPIDTKTAVEWAYPDAKPPYRWRYWNVKLSLRRLGCVPLRRLGGSARPWLWAPPATPDATPDERCGQNATIAMR